MDSEGIVIFSNLKYLVLKWNGTLHGFFLNLFWWNLEDQKFSLGGGWNFLRLIFN
jgi:hypothetical protein